MWDILGYAGEGDGTPTKKQLIPETTIFNQTQQLAFHMKALIFRIFLVPW